MSLWSKVRDYFFEPMPAPLEYTVPEYTIDELTATAEKLWRAGAEPADAHGAAQAMHNAVDAHEAQMALDDVAKSARGVLDGVMAQSSGLAPIEKTSPTKPVGVSGQVFYGGHLQTNERNPEMTGGAEWRFFEDAKRNCAAVGLGMRTYLTLAGAPDWNIEPWKAEDADEPTPEDVEWARWFEDSLGKMETPWKTVTQIAVLAAWEGMTMQAWHVKRDVQGRLALADLFWLEGFTIERWITDERNKVTGIVQRDPSTGAEVPVMLDQIAWNRDIPLTASPRGLGILRQLAETIRQIRISEKALGKGFEKDANQTPVIFGPIAERKSMIGKFDDGLGRNYTQADFDAEFRGAVEYATADKRKGAVVFFDSSPFLNPDGTTLSNVPRWRFEVIKASMESAEAQSAELKRLSWTVLAFCGLEFLLLGSDGVGSLAMSASKMENARRAIMQALNTWAQVFRREVIQPVWRLNGRDPDTAPTPTFESLELEDIAGIVQAMTGMLTAGGVEPGRVDHIINRILGVKGLPPLKDRDDEDLVLRREEEREAAAAAHNLDRKADDEDLEDEE